ncbi:DarT1-associated NADAR antitoxin family protein [Ureibacillus acetophenoni]|uniref:Uncharacterized protein n=1 Tax=Ureibacillus acetophenoni TaxID=614649 RepID=A0A285UGZ8_9BACL|nr:hypothetical protein [Ureibacillus acetophenoni]SOC40947.1 hypothetical protein SAMN05877842_10939 [Ureibacillus acetophenoni]
MAKRPIFISSPKSSMLFKRELIEFEWFSGFSLKQKQRSIHSLHDRAREKFPEIKLLEISSKSTEQFGIELSAFNLIIKKNNMNFSVETAFQASKVFELAGPFYDLYEKSSKEAKRDTRLKESGNLIAFRYFDREFPINPKTFFYNWLYINTLSTHPDLGEKIVDYDGFTDIEFNPHKSINCQAEAAAIYVSLVKNNLLNDALSSPEDFKSAVYNY